jgi:uncharacterized membrane protein
VQDSLHDRKRDAAHFIGCSIDRVVNEFKDGDIMERSHPSAASSTESGGTGVDRHTAAPPMEENVRAISEWEQSALHARSRAERLSDWITATAASGPVLLAHVIWFSLWTVLNLGLIRGWEPFDPFPFPFLTMTVSLEAIFLALFVLASQNRLAYQSDKRAHLDLQIDLLAEREMTAVLQLLQDIATHLNAPTSITTARLRELVKETDIHEITQKLDQMPDHQDRTPVQK